MTDASEPTQAAPGGAEPGWYPDPTNGLMRWWDGASWGAFQEGAAPGAPVAVGGGGVADPKQTAMWAHYSAAIGMFITCGGLGWVGPLIIFATSGSKDPYVKDQAAEALNFQIMLAIVAYVSYALSIILIGLIPLFIVWVAGSIMPVLAGQAASRGEQYRYPFSLRLVKGA